MEELKLQYVPDYESNSKSTSCGIGNWAPSILQKFANPKVYLILFCLAGIFQGAYFSYLIGVLSTLQKRYSFDTWISGIILLADNISPIVFSICIGYYGKQIHRPRFVALGLMVTGFCCFISCIPYILYGSELKFSNILSRNESGLCFDKVHLDSCDDKLLSQTIIAVSILFLANFLKGIGSSAYYNVGTPYLDDNVKKRKSPMYLGFAFATRIFGGTLGFLLSSFCLKFYENPFNEPEFSGPSDSLWIGAWWLGFAILGCINFLISLPMLLFPRHMYGTSKCSREEPPSTSSLYDLLLSLKKLGSNPILLFHTLSITFQINGLFAYFAFMPKYIENQFRSSASNASLYSGTATLIATVPTAFLGGCCISKLKPKPKYLLGYMLFVQIFAGAVMVTALFMSCSYDPEIESDPFFYQRRQSCSAACSCNKNAFSPVCDMNGNTHFSACIIGCQDSYSENNTVVFANCSCLKKTDEITAEAKKGFCFQDCHFLLPYIIVIIISKAIASTARAGNTLVTLRCVDEADKSLALGAVEFFISIFATLPYPLMYGYVIDKSCLLWDETCNHKGNCWFYDNSRYRYYYHGLSISFIFLAICCDFVVFLLSYRLPDLYEDAKAKASGEKDLMQT